MRRKLIAAYGVGSGVKSAPATPGLHWVAIAEQPCNAGARLHNCKGYSPTRAELPFCAKVSNDALPR
jgi:hypothetical protein